jgi:hypothetical protein
MRECLADDALLLTYYGEGVGWERQHLATCLPCAARYQRLSRDLAAIGKVLAQGDPRPVARRRPRLATVAIAAAALVLVALGEGWLWQASKSLTTGAAPFDVGTVAFLEDVDAVLSGTSDASTLEFGASPARRDGVESVGIDLGLEP